MNKLFLDPQYLIVNKTPSGGTRGTHYFWDPKRVKSIRAEAIDEIREVLETDGSQTRRLGFCFVIPYLEKNVDSISVLQRMLKISFQKNMPVLIKLDGLSWWETRSDLWNWWDPKMSGYNPNNIYNVERTGWDLNKAIKISWRNWGKQLRVKPHPNLGSSQFLKEKKQILKKIMPIIVHWYRNLPEDKKFLLAGVVLDNELSIGLNHYYYPNGNKYLSRNPKFDPKQHLNLKKGPSAGFVQLGYAAVKSYGIKKSGKLTLFDLNQVVHKHALFLGQTAISCGLDFDKIFIHGIGNNSKRYRKTYSFSNVITPYGHPGWSLYHDIANNPLISEELISAISKLNGSYWGAVEWFLFKRKKGFSVAKQWKLALTNILNYPNNKIVAIYNWEAISKRPMVINAIKEVLQEKPPNWLSPATITHKIMFWRIVQFSWELPDNATKSCLQISTKPNLSTNGGLAIINVINLNLKGLTKVSKLLKPGRYYYQIMVVSTSPFQKRFSNGSFTIFPIKTIISQKLKMIIKKVQ